MRPIYLIVCCLGAAYPAAESHAETAKSFRISADVVAGCSVLSDASGRWGLIDLGTVDGASPATVEAGLVSASGAGLAIECTPGVTAALSVDLGDHSSGGTRMLARSGGSGAIPYQLYAADGSTPWNLQPLPLQFGAGVSRRSIPVRARATLTGAIPAGLYTDTVRVTLSW
ncbi:Csu type fimbrial protein [Novosphingopyxis sp. YJ-S2-01]|uniref:Csu type fimbrial protein n=1 Tax=Novosphingopyxis sp. YJ-S2-01 TaxID=2794021 RepID=UPI001E5948F8|nr:spore coat U domain-containing protein [Novosphingopyxis sp. YJ-S2-01]